jgi:hypothetical protein
MKFIVPKASRGVNAQPIALFRKLWDSLIPVGFSVRSRFVALSARSQ